MKTFKNMTDSQISARIIELCAILEGAPSEMSWGDAYNEYEKLCAIQDQRYRQSYVDRLTNFYLEHIEGREWHDVDPDMWDIYSDWHKDVYGHRPSRP